jgi:hypothetical protein
LLTIETTQLSSVAGPVAFLACGTDHPITHQPENIMKTINRVSKTVVLSALVAIAASAAGSAFAGDTKWEKNHPRREQVNERLAKQNKRINNEVKEGDLTKAQGAALHKEDRQIRREERLMASQNGGHITKAEQKVLNEQENAVSKKIGK